MYNTVYYSGKKNRCLLRLSRHATELQSCKCWTRAVLKNTHVGFVKLDSFVLFCQFINCWPMYFKSRSFRLSFICSNSFVGDTTVEDRNNNFSAGIRGGLWLQGHTARASLLCSVGKIFHCVHYLSVAPRISVVSTIGILRHRVLRSRCFELQEVTSISRTDTIKCFAMQYLVSLRERKLLYQLVLRKQYLLTSCLNR